MASFTIKCEAVKISTDSGICPGSAKCRTGETYILTARTPEPTGMCGRAFAAFIQWHLQCAGQTRWIGRNLTTWTSPVRMALSSIGFPEKRNEYFLPADMIMNFSINSPPRTFPVLCLIDVELAHGSPLGPLSSVFPFFAIVQFTC